MSDFRHAHALTDDALDRDIAQALAVDPSPEFAARVRTRIANEPEPGMWRRVLALRSSWLVASVAVAAAVVATVVVTRSDRSTAPTITPTLTARAIGAMSVPLPYVGSGFSRTYNAQVVHSSLRSVGPAEAGPHVPPTVGPAKAGPQVEVLLDPRETRALRSLIAGVRDSRLDLSPLLRPSASAPMELPPVDDLVIAPLAIEPLAPIDGAQDPIARESARSGQGVR